MDLQEMLRLALILGSLVTDVRTRNATHQERIHRDILKDYEVVSPIQNASESTSIDLNFQLLQIRSLDGKHQVLETSGVLYMHWYDHRLTWNPADYGGIAHVTVDSRDVWVPLIGLRNSVKGIIDANLRLLFHAVVFFTGKVVWVYSGDFSSSCSLNMRRFPYDIQNCSLRFGSVMEPETMVNITSAQTEVDLYGYTESSEFHIDHTEVRRRVMLGTTSGGHSYGMPMIEFWLCIERKPQYYLLNIIVPTMVLALLLVLTFLAPVDSGEKLSVGISILLAFSVFMLLLSEITPQSSDNSALLGIYLTTVMSISGFNILCQMIILGLYFVENPRPVLGWLRNLERILSRCQPSPRVQHKGGNNMVKAGTDQLLKEMIVSAISLDDPASEKATGKNSNANNLGLDGVAHELKIITDAIKCEQREKALKNEWRRIGCMCDRVFFVFFLFVHVILIGVILGVLPEV